MNTHAHYLTALALHSMVHRPNPSPTASGAWRLMLTQHSPYATLDDMARCTVRIPETSLVELVRADQRAAENAGYHAPAVTLMREGIRDGLSCPAPGQGNRARRRIEALNMGARRKMCNPRGWDVVDTACPDCLPAAPAPAPASSHHLNCA